MNPLQGTVTAIDEEQACLTLDCAVPWDWGAPIYVAGQACDILHVEDNWVWVADVTNLLAGQKCTQVKFTGSVVELRKEFQDTWSARWQRHASVLESQWLDILQFAKQYARPIERLTPSLDPSALKREIALKKRKTA